MNILQRKFLRMKLPSGSVFSLLILTVVLLSCYPDSGLDSIADYDVVTTLYDKNVDFGSARTYAMPDSVIHLTIDTTGSQDDGITRQFDDQILSDVKRNMDELGYALIDISSSTPPDVIVLVSVTTTQWVGYSYYPGYWWGWWGWYGWWWGWGPGWGYGYPGVAVPFSFSTGSVIIEMGDPSRQDPQEQTIPHIWSGSLNGLLGSSQQTSAARIKNGIDQAFSQSPYLLVRE